MLSDIPLVLFDKYINYSVEKEIEETAWGLWQILYPDMVKNNIEMIPFNDFKIRLLKRPTITHNSISSLSVEEIIDEMERVKSQYEKRR